MGKPRHLHAGAGQQVGDVVGGGLAVHRGIERQDDLLDLRCVGACHQGIDRKLLRTDAVERRQRAAQYVVAGVDDMGAFQCPQIGDILDHHDY